ncbi:MAG: hypothetical protein J1E98_00885 [Lachnospiraceae bacterium]|nr:hypothetical protein [Lachnospiraceae bacterium]
MRINNRIDVFKIINLLFIAIIFIACLWDVGSLQRIRVVDDGFCYWGIAATMSGYDWTDLISASAYYSYGYSLILIPLFLLHRLGISMTIIYRLAIVMNACFLSGCYLMALYMIKELFKDIPDGLKYIISLFVTLYIGNTAQMGLAWTETFLLFMFWCIVVLMYRFIKKPGYLNVLGLAAATAWLFAIHMRSMGVVIAVCMILACYFISRFKEIDKKYIFYAIAVFAVFFCVMILLKNYVSTYIYAGTADKSVNNVQANVNRLGSLLNIRGLMDIAVSFIGKLYYFTSATFIMGMVGVFTSLFFLLSGLIKKIKTGKWNKWESKEWMTCFVLLSFLAEIGIEAIFKIAPYFRTIEATLYNDTVVFGRYSDFVVGPMLILGVWTVYHLREHYYEVIAGILMAILSTVVVQLLYNVNAFRMGIDTIGFRFASVPWLAIIADGHKIDFAYYVMMISIGVLIVICLIRLLSQYKWHSFGAMLMCIALMWAVLGAMKGAEYTASKVSKEKTVDTVAHMIEAVDNSLPVYLFGTPNTEVKILQWLLADRSIRVCSIEEISDIDTENSIILVNSSNTDVIDSFSQHLDFLYDSGNICVFGNPESRYYEALSAKADEMKHIADPTVYGINLAKVTTEYSYTKMNGSLYYNYRGTDGGYMTKEMGVTLKDGIYEFVIDMRVRDCVADTDIGYITVGCADGSRQYTQTLYANDFIKKARQKVRVSVEIRDNAEPFIGIYTYGEAAIRIYDISYQQIDG